MAEVTNELIYEALKQLQSDMAGVKEAWHETNARLNAMQTHLIALQQDTKYLFDIEPPRRPPRSHRTAA